MNEILQTTGTGIDFLNHPIYDIDFWLDYKRSILKACILANTDKLRESYIKEQQAINVILTLILKR